MKALFDEIRSCLDGDVSAAVIGETLTKVRVEIGRQRAARARHQAATIDLMASHADVIAADRALGDAILNERRLAEAERQLGAHRAAREAVEIEAARAEAYRNARLIRDAALVEVKRAWTAHANGLMALAQYVAEKDAEIRAAYDKPPEGSDALGGVMDGIGSLGSSPNTWRTVFEHMSIPDISAWDAPGYSGKHVLRM